MDRKELLLQDTSTEELTSEQVSKLRKAAEDGGTYLGLTGTSGWKHLLENFINKQISQDRYLTAKNEDLADIRAAQRELFNMLSFINRKIEDGQKSYERLQKEGRK